MKKGQRVLACAELDWRICQSCENYKRCNCCKYSPLDRMSPSKRLRNLRIAHFGEYGGQSKFARAIRISTSTYYCYERGTSPPIKTAAKIQKLTGVSLEWLANGTLPMYVDKKDYIHENLYDVLWNIADKHVPCPTPDKKCKEVSHKKECLKCRTEWLISEYSKVSQ